MLANLVEGGLEKVGCCFTAGNLDRIYWNARNKTFARARSSGIEFQQIFAIVKHFAGGHVVNRRGPASTAARACFCRMPFGPMDGVDFAAAFDGEADAP